MKPKPFEIIVEFIPQSTKTGITYEVHQKGSLIRCRDCKYYDPPHVENNGERHEYSEFPPEAFDPITKKYVSSSYGINIGGRCCRDYECGYSEDKRVFVTETNYCGRAERKETEKCS